MGIHKIAIATLSGVKYLDILGNNKNKSVVEEKMEHASLKPKDIPILINKRIVDELITMDDNEFYITCISVGSLCCVIFQSTKSELMIGV